MIYGVNSHHAHEQKAIVTEVTRTSFMRMTAALSPRVSDWRITLYLVCPVAPLACRRTGISRDKSINICHHAAVLLGLRHSPRDAVRRDAEVDHTPEARRMFLLLYLRGKEIDAHEISVDRVIRIRPLAWTSQNRPVFATFQRSA